LSWKRPEILSFGRGVLPIGPGGPNDGVGVGVGIRVGVGVGVGVGVELGVGVGVPPPVKHNFSLLLVTFKQEYRLQKVLQSKV